MKSPTTVKSMNQRKAIMKNCYLESLSHRMIMRCYHLHYLHPGQVLNLKHSQRKTNHLKGHNQETEILCSHLDRHYPSNNPVKLLKLFTTLMKVSEHLVMIDVICFNLFF